MNSTNNTLSGVITLCKKLHGIHLQNKFYGNINSETLQIQSNGDINTTNFKTAKRALYFSPEQTGRINRIVDYRTDLYSLGVFLYRKLTGVFPFDSDEYMELFHQIIAKLPVKPNEINPEIPLIVSEIIMKLLAKNPKDRYQSALGLKHDLELCMQNNYSSFELGSKDISGKFNIPEKLYGRESEIELFVKSFRKTLKGSAEMIMINGYSGIGKTSLVNEIQKNKIFDKGYFIKGKFDKLKRDVPYNAIIQAFQTLIQQLLTESNIQLAEWKKRILESLGPNAGVIIELIPELETIIGEHKAVVKLNPKETQNRFIFTFCDFIKVFATEENPLFIFLDDLQWCDISSFKLIQEILQVKELQHLLIIGAYRSNEVNDNHPLILSLNEIKKTRNITNIPLKPLDYSVINRMIADTLHCSLQYSQILTDVIYQKTKGNPFFITELLKDLNQKEIIYFNFEKGNWLYKPEEIRKIELNENIVEFLTEKLKNLAPETQKFIGTAACIGNHFELKMLSSICNGLTGNFTKLIFDSVLNGIISLPEENVKLFDAENDKINKNIFELKGKFRFQHDQLHQAAYSIIDKDKRKENHLSIGRLLLKDLNSIDKENRVIDIVTHLNEAIHLIIDKDEKLHLAQLNLKAGIKAKNSIAYQSALEYLTKGLELLTADSWKTHYKLIFEITKEVSECAYLSGKFDLAEEKSRILLQNAQTSTEKAEITRMQLVQYAVLDKLDDAIHSGIKGLSLLGVKIPYKPNSVSVLVELLMTKWNLRNKKIADLIKQPDMTDPKQLLIMNIMMELSPLAYMTNNENLTALIILKQVNISLKYGHTAVSAYAYGNYGAVILGEVLGDLKGRNEFGKLSLKLNEHFNDQKLKGRINFIYTLFIHHWSNPWKTVVPYFKEIIEEAYQAGDMYYMVFSCVNAIRWNPEMNLETFYNEQIEEYLPIIEASKYQDALDFNKVSLQMAANLLGLTDNRLSLSDKSFDETKCLQRMKESKNISGVAKYYLYKLQINYLYENYTNASGLIPITKSVIKSLLAIQWTVEFCLYSFLSQTAIFREMSFLKKIKTLRFLKKRYNQMKKWSDFNPSNYLHFKLLMNAEFARIKNKFKRAITFYNLAIKEAHNSGFIRYEALANELAAKFLSSSGQNKTASFYMKEALTCYSRWGASSKVKFLIEKYPNLTVDFSDTSILNKPDDAKSNIMLLPDTVNNKTLDLNTIIKSSQSISGEINLEKLLLSLIKNVLENAAAQKAFLILENEGEFTIEAEGEIGKEEVKLLESIPLSQANIEEGGEFKSLNKNSDILPLSIIQYTIRTKKHLVLQDASNESLYKNDPYIISNQTKSVLSAPIIYNQKLIGLIYLENNLCTSAFTDERLTILKILASQAAISIENARLYNKAQNEISEREQTEKILHQKNEELTKAKQKAEESDRLKTEFIENMSHEIRTPMNWILGFSEILNDPNLTYAKRKHYISIIKDSGNQLLQIIGDILEISKLDTKQVKAIEKEICLNYLLSELFSIFDIKAKENKIPLYLKTNLSDKESTIFTDQAKLNKILSNLLENALKFTESGYIEFGYQLKNNELEIYVKDTGIGISPDNQETVFEKFSQEEKGLSKKVGGLGLGLPIAKENTKLLGGEIKLQSEKGKGTTFFVTIPYKPVNLENRNERI